MSDHLRAHLEAAFHGRYAIERELAGGGMSRVFVATEIGLGRRVVIKVLAPELAAGVSIKRFEREITLAASLQQANIVPLLSAGQADGVAHYTMPFVQGVSLRERLAGGKPLPMREAIGILRDVARALAYAHEHGVVHRDIKPENVLLSGATAVVTDFGIAKALSAAGGERPERSDGAGDTYRSALTAVGTSVGTPAYMAPEQIAGDPDVDHRADLYSFGCLACELLTGAPPFSASTVQGLFAAHLSEQPEDIGRNRSDIPPALARVIMRCLAKSPSERPQSANEILDVIDSSGAALQPRWMRIAPAATAAVVVVIAIAGAVALRARGGPPGPRFESLAVLPLENLSGDSTQEFLTAGITERLITDLTRMSGLKRVVARGVVMQYAGTKLSPRKIAGELGVDALVTGSVLPSGDSLGISIHLMNPATGAELWANRYQRDRRDLLAIQNDIVSSVLHEIRARVNPSDSARLSATPTLKADAYEAYLAGRFYWFKATPADLTTAMKYFQRALEQDSTYALAYAGIALTYAARAEYGLEPALDAYAKATAAALHALQLDSTLSEAHHALATVSFAGEWNWKLGERQYRRAIELDPNDPFPRAFYGQMLAESGRAAEAASQIEQAVALDPHNAFLLWERGFRLYLSRQYDSAIVVYRKVLEEQPNGAIGSLVRALEQTGAYTEAARLRRQASVPGSPVARTYASVSTSADYRAALRTESVMLAERSRSTYVNPYRIAEHYAKAGDTERAFYWLARASRERAHRFIFRDPQWDGVRSDPRFRVMLHAFGDPP